MNPAEWWIRALLLILLVGFSVSTDIIGQNQSIKDGDVIVSGGKVFALGFFSPGSSSSRYVGIWYNRVSEQTVVWVANRDNPLNDTSGVLSIDSQGNLALYQKNQSAPVWSTNISVKGTKHSVAQLLDSGNLVLVQNNTNRVLLWQSFDHLTNTLLPSMTLGINKRSGLNRFLTSWKSPDDPGTGNYSYRIDPSGFPQLYLYKGSDPLWRTGTWSGQRWSGVPEMTSNYIFHITFVNKDDEVSITYGVTNASFITRLVLNETGTQQRFTWNGRDQHWIQIWYAPKEECDYYNHCGPNSNCDPFEAGKFECSCLPGFVPKSPQEWFLRDGSKGCLRKPGVSTCRSGEGFVKVPRVKAPDTSSANVDMGLGLKQCEAKCLSNCSCVAYGSAYYESQGGGVTGCLTWHGDMLDTRSYTGSGQDLYVRVDASELARYKKTGPLQKKGILAALIISIAGLFVMAVFFCWLVRRKVKGKRRQREYAFSFSTSFEDSSSKELSENRRNADLPFFDLSTIAAATNNFSFENKLGQGGFGSVYKGVLVNGKEIAVKRLSKHSGQGIQEFKNEIQLIARLQHRNLVRMIGCCIKEEEKLLVYEYLPNKSLDSFIFDETKRSLLDWRKRYEIICGIARGILYLHQDSRLRIIHRDLKASNVLLDAEMNPKISDFGMARIFGGDQIEGNTNRVVGTYGYMPPEYAMKGLFSIKSDVYSFGVLLLEIITGKRNSSHYPEYNSSSSLVGHVWDLWVEGRAMELVDSSFEDDSFPVDEVQRCIQMGLLCVQDSATDRPTMSSVVFMLGNDTAALPSPKQPAFIVKSTPNEDEGRATSFVSINEVTVTRVEPR